jgi:predicted nucleic acid-binding protein
VLLVVDTGVLVSSVDRSEPRHDASADLLRDHAGALAVPGPVVPETAWFIESRLGPAAESQFLRLITGGELEVIDLTIADYQRCITLIDTYADMGLGLVDASVVVIAENLGITAIATHNQRDFRVVKPIHVDAFTLLP